MMIIYNHTMIIYNRRAGVSIRGPDSGENLLAEAGGWRDLTAHS